MTRQTQRENLHELLDEHIQKHGEFSAEELAEAHEVLYGDADEVAL
jgi:hypothetical protein